MGFRGLCAFPITPLDACGQVDAHSLRDLVKRLIEAEVDSIGLLGSTGTYMYMDRAARRHALEVAVAETADRAPIIAGIGALRTDEAIAFAQDAKAIGAKAGLLSAASYTPLTEREVLEHFASVARASGLPIVIYDNPGTTHFRFSPTLIAELSQIPGIIAIKNPGQELQSAAQHLADQRHQVPAGFSIGYSADWLCTESLISGADTWYSVLAGLWPKVCMRMTRAAMTGNAVEARRLNTALEPVWNLFRDYSSLRVIYAFANSLTICNAVPPRPILPLPDAALGKIEQVLAALPDELMQ